METLHATAPWAGIESHSYDHTTCVDCGALISSGSTRCYDCAWDHKRLLEADGVQDRIETLEQFRAAFFRRFPRAAIKRFMR